MEFTKEELATEEWRDVIGYEGLYQISDLGRVKSLSRFISNGTGFHLSEDRILKPNILAKGYFQVDLKNRSKRKVVLYNDCERFVFDSVADTKRFLGLKRDTNLQKVLHKVKHHNTIKGYKAEYYDTTN